MTMLSCVMSVNVGGEDTQARLVTRMSLIALEVSNESTQGPDMVVRNQML